MESRLLWPATATGRKMTIFQPVSVAVRLALNMLLGQIAVADLMTTRFSIAARQLDALLYVARSGVRRFELIKDYLACGSSSDSSYGSESLALFTAVAWMSSRTHASRTNSSRKHGHFIVYCWWRLNINFAAKAVARDAETDGTKLAINYAHSISNCWNVSVDKPITKCKVQHCKLCPQRHVGVYTLFLFVSIISAASQINIVSRTLARPSLAVSSSGMLVSTWPSSSFAPQIVHRDCLQCLNTVTSPLFTFMLFSFARYEAVGDKCSWAILGSSNPTHARDIDQGCVCVWRGARGIDLGGTFSNYPLPRIVARNLSKVILAVAYSVVVRVLGNGECSG